MKKCNCFIGVDVIEGDRAFADLKSKKCKLVQRTDKDKVVIKFNQRLKNE